jgi:hypothetical protein
MQITTYAKRARSSCAAYSDPVRPGSASLGGGPARGYRREVGSRAAAMAIRRITLRRRDRYGVDASGAVSGS